MPASATNQAHQPTAAAPIAPGTPDPAGGRRATWIFDADFYRSVLPLLVARDVDGRADTVPVVELKLTDGAVLDLCQILRLDERWMAVSYYRDVGSCDDADTAFVPYGGVARVHVSEHPVSKRRIGFSNT